MKRSKLIDYRIKGLCSETVCTSRLVWFHPSQKELKDMCMSEVMQSACDTHLIYGSNMSSSYKTRADFIQASFYAQSSRDSRFGYNKKNKLRLIHKHCNMAESNAIKKCPRMRKMERGKKVYTYKIGEHVYFTCKPKQKGCSEYTVYKVTLVCKQGYRKIF